MDSSVYDAMVRMSQIFKMGTPLIDGHGNWGSIDGDSAAAMRYCVIGNTILNTNKGKLRIDEIVKNSKLNSETNINLKIRSIGGNINNACKFFNSGFQEVIKITTSTGRVLIGSYNHPIVIIKNNIFQWATMETLQIGNNAVIDNALSLESSNPNYLLETIINIKKMPPQVVYSIKVDSNCHSFIANGFINHNTECKLQPISLELLKELNKDIVEYIPNFDETELEPTILPSILPNLFLNGTEGIAVGFKTEIPPHNLIELTDAIISYIKNPNISFEKLLEILPAPDYPTGGSIVNKEDMLNLYKTGEGTVSIRAKLKREESTNGKVNLIITEIPYTQSGRKQSLIDNIADLVKEKKVDFINDIVDESQGDDIRIVVEIKKGFDIEDVKHILYKKTTLQENQTCNFLVINNNIPETVNIKRYIQLYLDFQKEILTNKYEGLLKKAHNKKDIYEGLLIAIDYIDVVIETLRGAKNRESVKACFRTGNISNIIFKTKKNEKIAKTFRFSELQCNAILEMRLERLINLEADKITNDKLKLEKDISNYKLILNDKKKMSNIIINNLKYMKCKYGVKRKTILTSSKIKDIETKIVKEKVQVVIDRFGYIKTLDLASIQRSSEDCLKQFKYSLVINNTDKLCLFTKLGQLYQIKLSDIPKCKIKDKGIPLDVLSKFNQNDDILLITSFESIKDNKILFILNNGFIRNVPAIEYNTIRQNIIATTIENNEILDIKILSNEKFLLLKTNKKEYKIDLSKIPLHKKNVKGKKVISLKKDEKISKILIK